MLSVRNAKIVPFEKLSSDESNLNHGKRKKRNAVHLHYVHVQTKMKNIEIALLGEHSQTVFAHHTTRSNYST